MSSSNAETLFCNIYSRSNQDTQVWRFSLSPRKGMGSCKGWIGEEGAKDKKDSEGSLPAPSQCLSGQGQAVLDNPASAGGTQRWT